ncbi:hypothetical protein [Bradyrhizobium sp.]|uniref:hypothetical protein n=1 Tax=Bradyrhizobium sp. TaxID=376 RepID=UPI002D30FD45|nr:hypothetical protein [Bradyrhizobium sp.]HZR76895.1 hypothetical protein [Bradyrhizobium sp.]
MLALRNQTVLMAAMIGCVAVLSSQARAQWWSHAPADFEECADVAEKTTAKDARTKALADCNAKFAGRRKPGGGYTYFDFMQNRSFDIAGPNPTAEEQKQIDEQYAAYLESQRRHSIAAAFAAKQQQLQQQSSLKSTLEKALPLATASVPKPPVPARDPRRAKPATCPRDSFSCEWPRLSESISDLKKALFGSPSSKPARPKQGFSG